MTLFRRGKIWWTEFEIGGRTYRRSTGERTKHRAYQIERRLMSEALDVKSLARLHEMRLGEAINRYAKTVILQKPHRPDGALRNSTKNIIHYLHRIERHFGRQTVLRHLCQPGVIADYNEILLRSMKPISANKYLTWIRALLNRAYEWGALDYRPKVTLNRVRWARSRFLTEAEEKRLIRYCPDRIVSLIEFFLDTGARKDEALRLTWGEVDLRRKPRPVVYFVDTKNGEARVVPLPKRSADNLRAMKRLQRGRSSKVFVHPAVRTIYRNDGSGILAREGELAPIASFQKSWEVARSQAGVPDCRLHDLRHTYASRLVRKGVPILYVARLLGHRTIGMTMRYSHLTPVDLDQAVAVLDEA